LPARINERIAQAVRPMTATVTGAASGRWMVARKVSLIDFSIGSALRTDAGKTCQQVADCHRKPGAGPDNAAADGETDRRDGMLARQRPLGIN